MHDALQQPPHLLHKVRPHSQRHTLPEVIEGGQEGVGEGGQRSIVQQAGGRGQGGGDGGEGEGGAMDRTDQNQLLHGFMEAADLKKALHSHWPTLSTSPLPTTPTPTCV